MLAFCMFGGNRHNDRCAKAISCHHFCTMSDSSFSLPHFQLAISPQDTHRLSILITIYMATRFTRIRNDSDFIVKCSERLLIQSRYFSSPSLPKECHCSYWIIRQANHALIDGRCVQRSDNVHAVHCVIPFIVGTINPSNQLEVSLPIALPAVQVKTASPHFRFPALFIFTHFRFPTKRLCWVMTRLSAPSSTVETPCKFQSHIEQWHWPPAHASAAEPIMHMCWSLNSSSTRRNFSICLVNCVDLLHQAVANAWNAFDKRHFSTASTVLIFRPLRRYVPIPESTAICTLTVYRLNTARLLRMPPNRHSQ